MKNYIITAFLCECFRVTRPLSFNALAEDRVTGKADGPRE